MPMRHLQPVPEPEPHASSDPIDIGNGWVASVELSQGDGKGLVAALTIRPAGELPEGGLTATVLRSVRLGDLAQRARLRQANDYAVLAEQLLDSDKRAMRRMPGPRGRRDHHYALVASQYLHLVGNSHKRPLVELAHLYEVPPGTVENWLREARNRHLLSRSQQPGKPGGHLTDRGREALSEGQTDDQ